MSNTTEKTHARAARPLFLAGVLAAIVAASGAAAQDELWDTRLTYGFSADPDATGLERGEQVYDQWCMICHGTGAGMAGTEALERRYQGDPPALLTERDDLLPETITTFVRYGVGSMPFFRKTEISDEDLALLAEFLTNDGGD